MQNFSMPTKKKRIGFIPRGDVLNLINKLSHENNLSYSRIINILVEEALYKRGLFNLDSSQLESKYNRGNANQEKIDKITNEFTYNFKNNLLNNQILTTNKGFDDSLDIEIYNKFIIFLQFQERIKKRIK